MARELPSGPPAQASLTVSSLEQARLLTDRIKLRLLMAFAEGPATTMQVADVLGEPPTRLYRHVDALVAAGLLELVGERRKRGTTEKYLRAVARRFEVDHALFTTEPAENTNPLITDLFRMAEAGVRRSLVEQKGAVPMIFGAKVRGSERRITELWEQLQEIVANVRPDDCGEETRPPSGGVADPSGGEEPEPAGAGEADTLRTFGLLVAIYEDD